MIQDTLNLAHNYEPLSSRLAQAFAFLQQINGNESLGRHEIAGADIFALIQRYTTRPEAAAQLEAHRKYIDVQYIHQGCELMLWAPLVTMGVVNMAYDENQDAALFQLVPEMSRLCVNAGSFTIFNSNDAHAPCLVWGNTCEVFKVVVKVKID